MIYAKIKVLDIKASLTDDGWSSDSKALQDLLNNLNGQYSSDYAPNIYQAQAEYAADLLGGEVTFVKELKFEEGLVY